MGGMVGLTATWATALAVLPLFERVLPIIEAQPESVSGGTVLRSLSGRIEFEHVTFRYPSAESDTLQNVSFHIRPGEYVAFVGPSGAGKSTVYRLLLGFERPTAGSVLLDGHDLLSLNLDAMRRQFGVVLQNGQLTPASIFMNIVGEASLTEKEAWGRGARGPASLRTSRICRWGCTRRFRRAESVCPAVRGSVF